MSEQPNLDLETETTKCLDRAYHMLGWRLFAKLLERLEKDKEDRRKE